MTDLPPFSENACCPKCGCSEIKSAWQKADERRKFSYFHEDPREHILRTCQRCWFKWEEAPLSLESQKVKP